MWVFSRQLIYRDNKCYIGTPSFTVCVDEYNQWKGTSATIASQASKKKMANFINTNLHGYGRKIISDLSNFDIFLQDGDSPVSLCVVTCRLKEGDSDH